MAAELRALLIGIKAFLMNGIIVRQGLGSQLVGGMAGIAVFKTHIDGMGHGRWERHAGRYGCAAAG